jgi:hypothetical protein
MSGPISDGTYEGSLEEGSPEYDQKRKHPVPSDGLALGRIAHDLGTPGFQPLSVRRDRQQRWSHDCRQGVTQQSSERFALKNGFDVSSTFIFPSNCDLFDTHQATQDQAIEDTVRRSEQDGNVHRPGQGEHLDAAQASDKLSIWHIQDHRCPACETH